MIDQTRGLSTALATHVSQAQYANLPAATVLATKRAILDGLGVMLAASGTSAEVVPFVKLARSLGGTGRASILGHNDRVSAPMAAFANGAMAHALDYEDAFDAAPVHPNASLLPAALAIAQAYGPVSGRDFIAAVATGCDLVCRMALALRQPMEVGGWYPPPILGGFGAAAAAARLLRLTPAQTRDAFSLLLCQNTCPGEIKHSAASVIRAIREAFPAQAAVTSALLATEGVAGFEAPLEGKSGFYSLYAGGHFEPDALLDQLGTHCWIEELSFKKWPCCRGTHAYIEAAQRLRREHDLDTNNIVTLRITGGQVQRMLCEPLSQKAAPQTIIDAKFSVPFCTAAALRHDEVSLDSFTPATLRDTELLALTRRCEFLLRPDWGHEHAASGKIELVLLNGRTLNKEITRALGHPDRPIDTAALRAKFIDCASRAATPVAPAVATTLADRILALEQEIDMDWMTLSVMS